jgi:hypothetical protein
MSAVAGIASPAGAANRADPVAGSISASTATLTGYPVSSIQVAIW